MKFQSLPLLVAILLLSNTPVPSIASLESYLETYVGFITVGRISDAIVSTNVTQTGVYYSQTGAIYVGPYKDTGDLYVSQNINDLVSNNSAPSNFLPVNANKACFLKIVREAFGDWFFTDFLSGCEVWIAVANGQEPLMFHVNTRDCNYTTGDLEERENMAVEALASLNSTYAFVYRLMSPKPNAGAISDYLKAFHNRHPNVFVGEYGSDGGIFYGQYPAKPASINTVVYAGWSFRCKIVDNTNLYNIGKSIIPVPGELENELQRESNSAVKNYKTDTEMTDYMNNVIMDQVSKRKCAKKIKAMWVAEGVYKFGDYLYRVHLFEDIVMVGIEGDWETLDVFLHKHVPCQDTCHGEPCINP